MNWWKYRFTHIQKGNLKSLDKWKPWISQLISGDFLSTFFFQTPIVRGPAVAAKVAEHEGPFWNSSQLQQDVLYCILGRIVIYNQITTRSLELSFLEELGTNHISMFFWRACNICHDRDVTTPRCFTSHGLMYGKSQGFFFYTAINHWMFTLMAVLIHDVILCLTGVTVPFWEYWTSPEKVAMALTIYLRVGWCSMGTFNDPCLRLIVSSYCCLFIQRCMIIAVGINLTLLRLTTCL